MRGAHKFITGALGAGLLAGGLLASGLAVLPWGSWQPSVAAAAPTSNNGLRIAPAAITLGLAKSQSTTSQSFMLTNNYAVPVSVDFSLQLPARHSLNGHDPRQYLHLAVDTVTIPAGGQATQTITLTDAASLTPGSQNTEIVVTQQLSGGSGIGIVSSARLPVTVIKYDGAKAAFGAAGISQSPFAWHLPHAITVSLPNTGNIVAIPRGVVTVQSLQGKVLAQGVLNPGSQAIEPGARLSLPTNLTSLSNAWLPGLYSVHVDYGLGGDTVATAASSNFVLYTWWQAAITISLVTAAWYVASHSRQLRRRRPAPPTHHHKRQLLIGRDIT
jgi:hypothetical protein